MSGPMRGSTTETMRLLPHQAAFVERLLRVDGKRVLALQAPAGFGKSSAIVAAVGRLLEERPSSRVLMLAPKVVGAQYADRLRHFGVKAAVVDRYRFRELRNAVAHGQLWPEGVVVVLSLDFAKQRDVLATLAIVPWTLVVTDELERFGEQGKAAVRAISAASTKVVIAMPARRAPSTIFAPEDVEYVEWRRQDLVDRMGRPLAGPRPSLRRATYWLTEAERSMASTVEGLCFAIEAAMPHAEGVARSLRSALWSSPAALESSLQSLSIDELALAGVDLSSDDDSDERPGRVSQADDAVLAIPGIVDLASAANRELEALADDSKVARLVQLVTETKQSTAGEQRRVWVLTKYVSTLFYVAAALESAQLTVAVMQSNSDADERRKALESSEQGDVLLATHASMKGFEPPGETTDLVIYDLPGTAELAYVLVSRFDQLRRPIALKVHVLVPENLDTSFVVRGVQYVQAAIGGKTQAGA